MQFSFPSSSPFLLLLERRFVVGTRPVLGAVQPSVDAHQLEERFCPQRRDDLAPGPEGSDVLTGNKRVHHRFFHAFDRRLEYGIEEFVVYTLKRVAWRSGLRQLDRIGNAEGQK